MQGDWEGQREGKRTGKEKVNVAEGQNRVN
jgi:hypothetical protein